MNPALLAVMISAMILVLLSLLPLGPAILIYKIFPDTKVVTNGPFSGLTLRSSGAFSIYFIVFLALAPFAIRTFNMVSLITSPSWTIVGKIKLIDSEGKSIPLLSIDKKILVTLTPDLIHVEKDYFKVKVPEIENSIPALTFSVGDLGSEVVNFENLGSYSISRDNDKKSITFDNPVSIRIIKADSAYSQKGALTPVKQSQALPVLTP